MFISEVRMRLSTRQRSSDETACRGPGTARAGRARRTSRRSLRPAASSARCRTLGGKCRDAHLECETRFEHLVGCESVKCGQHPRVHSCRASAILRFGDKCSRSLFRLQNADRRQRSDAGTQRRTTDAEQLRKIALGRQDGRRPTSSPLWIMSRRRVTTSSAVVPFFSELRFLKMPGFAFGIFASSPALVVLHIIATVMNPEYTMASPPRQTP